MSPERIAEEAYERGEADGAADEYERLYQKVVNRISADIAGSFDEALDQLVYNSKMEERRKLGICIHNNSIPDADCGCGVWR